MLRRRHKKPTEVIAAPWTIIWNKCIINKAQDIGSIQYEKYTVNVEIFRMGVIFTFFALLSSTRKLPPHENKTHMHL